MKKNSYRVNYKVVLDWSNSATKSKLKETTDVYTSDIATYGDFTAFKAEVNMLDMNRLANVLKNLKGKKHII